MIGETTIDEVRRYGLKVRQPKSGYRFSLDPLLLCDFVPQIREGRMADLGTGCGIIPLILAAQGKAVSVLGVEFQQEMAELAAKNVEMNSLRERIEIRHADILKLPGTVPPSSFDLVVANPPYRIAGSGRISPRAGRDLARHESSAGLGDFMAVAKYLVKPGGSMCLICHPSRLSDFFRGAQELKLAVPRLCMVHGTATSPATMFLAELVKGRKGSTTILPPLVVRGSDGEYTAEVNEILFGM